MINHDTRIELT